MDADTRRLIEAIHRASHKCVLALTGGGAQVAGLLLSVPRGSRTVLEVHVPYHEQALAEYLGRQPAQSCSAATSRDMAARAYERARWLSPDGPVIGVGCTASLATDRPKRGEHRFHVAMHTDETVRTYSATLRKGAREREAEEAVLDAVVLNALAEAIGISERLSPSLLPDETLQVEVSPADLLASLLRNELSVLCAQADGQLSRTGPRPAALLPGAFNPVHEGHWRLAEVAARMTGARVAFELSATNVDKPPLTLGEIRRRLQQFAWRMPVWITRAPTFVEKASLFPGVVFVVGADTAERILACRYYQDSEARLADALDHIRKQGCRFLVAGRENREGNFVGLEDLTLPEAYRDLFSGIPQSDFHVCVSSTSLRGQVTSDQTVASSLEGE